MLEARWPWGSSAVHWPQSQNLLKILPRGRRRFKSRTRPNSYTNTNTLHDETGVKKAFYGDLHNLLQHVDSKDKPLILGNFNARVGRDFEVWKGVLGRHGISNCKDNGRLHLELCSEHQLVITSTLFQLKDRFKASWGYPRPKHGHLLDYVLTHQCDKRDILHTRVMPSANCCTDHSLVRCRVAFTIKSPPKRKGPPLKKLQVHRLRDPRVKYNFHVRGETSFCDRCRT